MKGATIIVTSDNHDNLQPHNSSWGHHIVKIQLTNDIYIFILAHEKTSAWVSLCLAVPSAYSASASKRIVEEQDKILTPTTDSPLI